MVNIFDKYIDLQKRSANRHKGEIQEHDGYIKPHEDKFFACICDNEFTIISIQFSELDKYEFVRDINSMFPLVRFKDVAV